MIKQGRKTLVQMSKGTLPSLRLEAVGDVKKAAYAPVCCREEKCF